MTDLHDLAARIRYVLVRTSHPGNIGSAARAIRTMGFTRLELVTPYRFPDPEAHALANEARNLSGLPVSTLEELQGQVDRTRALLGEAPRVAFDVGDIQKAFDARYKGGEIGRAP